ncbi:MAG: hypothetical protein JWR87_2723 [Segetibacter sp.]|jgi:hypothetical protein|nr:hypothetical protein [Segetibacter sp.]
MGNECRLVKGKMELGLKRTESNFYRKEIQEWCTEKHGELIPLFVFSVFLPPVVLCG